MKYLSFCCIFFLFTSLFAINPQKDTGEKTNENLNKTQSGSEEADKTVQEGNLAFPVSQQPTPLVAFGQNILNKKQVQLLTTTNEFKGKDTYFINFISGLLYGFTDNFSILIANPFAVRYREKENHSSGSGDIFVQLEYAFYTKAYKTYYDQATIVANITIPTGSTKKNPPTGIGSNSFFIGATYSRMAVDWFYFTSHGAILTTSSNRTKFGDQFLYQFGIGKRIFSNKRWLYAWMVELDGTYTEKDRIHGKIDPNSGGNIIYIIPSLWLSSSESLILQLGFGYPVQQHLFGNQTKNDYFLQSNLNWTF